MILQKQVSGMASYIACLKSLEGRPLFEVAFCESEAEAREWADQLVAFAPGFEVAEILSAGAQSGL